MREARNRLSRCAEKSTRAGEAARLLVHFNYRRANWILGVFSRVLTGPRKVRGNRGRLQMAKDIKTKK